MKVIPTTTLQLDETTTVDVHMLPPQIRQLVELYDTWRQEEADIAMSTLKIQGAMRDLVSTLNDLVTQYVAETQSEGPSNAAE